MAKRIKLEPKEEHKHQFIFNNDKEQLKMCECGKFLMSLSEYGKRANEWKQYYSIVRNKWLPVFKRTLVAYHDNKMEEAKRLSQTRPSEPEIIKPKFSDPSWLSHEKRLEVYE